MRWLQIKQKQKQQQIVIVITNKHTYLGTKGHEIRIFGNGTPYRTDRGGVGLFRDFRRHTGIFESEQCDLCLSFSFLQIGYSNAVPQKVVLMIR